MSAQFANSGEFHKCTRCFTPLKGELFNAFHRPVGQGQAAELVKEQGQAQCFYHPGKKAVIPCSSCGRLLCALCEIPFGDRSLCTNCLQSGRDKQKIESLEKSRFLYDSIALHLAFWPVATIVFFYFSIITAPAVIYLVLRYWSAPSSILPRSKFRFIVALILAIAQVAGWVVVLVAAIS